MRKIERLMKMAKEAASFRQHKLSKFTHGSENRASAECVHCGAWVIVNSKPAPNDIDIGGLAVAVNCPRTEKL